MNKTCPKCKTQYPATKEFFHSDKSKKDGLASFCKKCKKANTKKHYEENKEKAIAYAKKYREENKEKTLAYAKKYYEKNKDRQNSRKKKYYQENKEKFASRDKEKIEKLCPSYVAGALGIRVKDMTPEIYETKKLIIQLKRETR